MLRSVFPAALALTLIGSPALAADWVQAPDSRLAFAGKYQASVFVGNVPGFSTRLRFDPAKPADARLDVNITMTSATTGNREYDPEMHGSGFFHSRAFPQARYTAQGARRLPDGRYAMDGTLTLRGISRPVSLTFEWQPGARPVLIGRATVQRLDFKVGDGQWADTRMIPNAIAISTHLNLQPARP